METLWLEVKSALRGLRRSPGFALGAVLTLTIGLGATTAVLAGLDAALLRALPYRAPEELVHLWETQADSPRRQLSYPDYLDLARAGSFAAVAGYGYTGATLRTTDGVANLAGARVSASFFRTLGVEPALGRAFADEEDRPGRTRDVVVLSDGAWRKRFGADPGIVGRSITLSSAPYTVIGVLPRGFTFARLGDPEYFVTLSPSNELAARRLTHWMWGVARLAPGRTIEEAQGELDAIARNRAAEDPEWHEGTGLDAMPIREAFLGEVEPLLFGLFAGVTIVLLIACANVAAMSWARAAGREREVAIRLALGVGRGRLLAKPLIESFVVALAGGALGAAAGIWGARAIAAAVPAGRARSLPFLAEISLRPEVIGMTFAACLFAAALTGAEPVLRLARRRKGSPAATAASAMTVATARGASTGTPGRLRIVAAEIALALVLVTSAGLVGRSLQRLLAEDSGMDRDRLLTALVALPRERATTPEAQTELFRRIEEQVEAIPGVGGAAFVDQLPLQGQGNSGTPRVVGRDAAGGSGPEAQLRTVSPGYFDVAGVPVLAGRDFAATDRAEAPGVVLVNATLARALFGSEPAVGRALSFAFLDDRPLEVVGVVGDENVGALGERPSPAVYFAASQESSRASYLVARTTVPPESLERALGAAVRRVDSETLVAEIASLDALVADSPPVFVRRYPLRLLSSFAALALLLAAIGVYGVMAGIVGQSRRELGIRLAVGARPADLRALVLGRGGRVAATGIAFGLAASWLAARLLGKLLYPSSAADPGVFVAAAAVLVGATLAASAVPARRAMRVDPQEVLRAE